MIVDDIDERFTEALVGTQAGEIDLQWNMAVGAVADLSGRPACDRRSVHRVVPFTDLGGAAVMDLPIDVFLAPAPQLHKFAFDLVQQMQGFRQQAMLTAHGPGSNGQGGPT